MPILKPVVSENYAILTSNILLGVQKYSPFNILDAFVDPFELRVQPMMTR
jgi:hypothetical protein